MLLQNVYISGRDYIPFSLKYSKFCESFFLHEANFFDITVALAIENLCKIFLIFILICYIDILH
jgi:hypothetical protein